MVDEFGFDLAREMSYPTPFQNLSLLPLLLISLVTEKHTPDTKRSFKSEYDYIVVGAGTAGCVVAARLSQDPSKTVLLLEAGKSPPLLTELPNTRLSFIQTEIDWNYFTEPQKYAAFANENNRVAFASGKGVGGTSLLSGNYYIRGNRADYNAWEKQGAHGWGWQDVYPYFLKSEDNMDPDIANNGFHSVGGPMQVARTKKLSELEIALINTVLSLGYTYDDANDGNESGFVDLQTFVRNGQRLTTAKAYLVPAENRPNLDIVAEAHVTKVLIEDRTARGVQFDFEGLRYEVRAKSEVILSAGAISSPQILMLSGIGPRSILERFGIPVIEDLPVGKNYQDHASASVKFYSTKDRPTHLKEMQDLNNILSYMEHRAGPVSSLLGAFGVALLADNVTAQLCDVPEYELYFIQSLWGDSSRNGLSQKVYDKLFTPYVDTPTAFCISQYLDPQSRGYISIRSSNPYDPPVIDPEYYKAPEDLIRVVQGMKTCHRIMDSPLMKNFGFKPFETVMPGCEGLSDQDEYLECYARNFVLPDYHPCGSVKMGDISDPNTVVDPNLRVKGINKLRVVDASVMPKIVPNPEAPVIMIAEKASDIIKSSN